MITALVLLAAAGASATLGFIVAPDRASMLGDFRADRDQPVRLADWMASVPTIRETLGALGDGTVVPCLTDMAAFPEAPLRGRVETALGCAGGPVPALQ
jgi:hypothetical protein